MILVDFNQIVIANLVKAINPKDPVETGCFLLAAAQSGTHPTDHGSARRTYGHSMVISPWGEVLLNLKSALGFGLVDLNLEDVDTARNRVPSLRADTQYAGPLHE